MTKPLDPMGAPVTVESLPPDTDPSHDQLPDTRIIGQISRMIAHGIDDANRTFGEISWAILKLLRDDGRIWDCADPFVIRDDDGTVHLLWPDQPGNDRALMSRQLLEQVVDQVNGLREAQQTNAATIGRLAAENELLRSERAALHVEVGMLTQRVTQRDAEIERLRGLLAEASRPPHVPPVPESMPLIAVLSEVLDQQLWQETTVLAGQKPAHGVVATVTLDQLRAWRRSAGLS